MPCGILVRLRINYYQGQIVFVNTYFRHCYEEGFLGSSG